MSVDILWRPEVGKKVEEFFSDANYKEYVENAVAFNRKLNEERKMRLPYIDGQTGVAQRHYNGIRLKRERMPGMKPGQIYSYPQKAWRKKRYQYLRYFLQPKRLEQGFCERGDSLMGVAGLESSSTVHSGAGHNDDSNHSLKEDVSNVKSDWQYDDLYDETANDDPNSDSDFEYEDSYSRRRARASSKKGSKSKAASSRHNVSASSASKRKSHVEPMVENDKPFYCEQCGARYKTRPGLNYHINHAHKDRDLASSNAGQFSPFGLAHEEALAVPDHVVAMPSLIQAVPVSVMAAKPLAMTAPQVANSSDLDLSGSSCSFSDSLMHSGAATGRPSRRATQVSVPKYREEPHYGQLEDSNSSHGTPSVSSIPPAKKVTDSEGKQKPVSSAYCDFCLGDAQENKKTHTPEQLVSCSECGRSGHPSCLQFTDNMLKSVRTYPWQCIECKTCNICGTSEHDDQLLFCDDCDRGYHMYCLLPPIKEPPEGSWSCKLCINTFHSKK